MSSRLNAKSYGSSGDQSHCVPGASGFQRGRYADRASPLSRPASGRQGPPVFTPTRVVPGPSPEHQLVVYRTPAASVGRSVFHPSITSPVRVSESHARDPASVRAVSTRLFTTRPRSFSAPVRGSSAVDLSDDGCPAWGAAFCLRSDRGSTVYLERVAAVREVEVLCTDFLDHDPYIVARWRQYWSRTGLTDVSQLRLIRKQGLLGLNAEYIARARRATTRLHTWGAVCKHELAGGKLYPVTFEILFQFLEDSLAASHAAHMSRESRPDYKGKQFKGTAPLGLIRDLKTAARLFKLEIPVQVTGDELLLSHFSVARTVDSMPEQAVLGFRTWCGLELQAAALVGMDPKTGRVDESARLPPPAHATPHWVPAEPVPAPLIEGWGPEFEHTVDAAQTFVVCLLASLRTVEMRRSQVHSVRRRDNGSTVVVGFCAGGKSPKGLSDRQPFYWFVDSNMGVNGTTNLWLHIWAKKRLKKGWIFPDYSLEPDSGMLVPHGRGQSRPTGG